MRPLLAAVLVCSALGAFYAGFESDLFRVWSSPSVTVRVPAVSSSGSIAASSGSAPVMIPIPAVSRSGEGALARFSVQTAAGSGKLFFESDSDSPLTNPDTQLSVRTAVQVARQLAGPQAQTVDVFVSFQAESEVVSGASAGAGVAVATLAALQGASLKPGVLVTGAVSPEGKITAVGKVLQKARAAGASGVSMLLVPIGESSAVVEKPSCKSEAIGEDYYRSCKPVSVTVAVSAESGVDVVEVDNVLQAFALMRQN